MSELDKELQKNQFLREKNKKLIYQVCKKYLREIKPLPNITPTG